MGRDDRGATPMTPLSFGDLRGWTKDDQAAAFGAFRNGAGVLGDHPPKTRALGIDAAALAGILTRAGKLPAELSPDSARSFFETEFVPHAVGDTAFFTGYYEPEVRGSILPTTEFQVPLLRTPADLVEIEPGTVAGLDMSFRFAGRTAGGFGEYADRGAIAAGALAGRGLELVYLHDPVDAFFIHIQGAARIRLGDGRLMRATYAAKTGHPYTPIGKVLIEMGALSPGEVTMATIRAWLAAHPADAAGLMARNRSYIFFREAAVDDAALGPVAAANVPLTAGRSLAVDRLQHAFHSPVWIETTLPGGAACNRLMIAQDTGSAIVGPARGDIFFGSGDAAGAIAGSMRAGGRFIMFMPRGESP
jgi:membrane-bound lytic murein transglycosylase A